MLAAEPGTPRPRATRGRLRDALGGFDETYVGGTEAETIDDATRRRATGWLIIPLILARGARRADALLRAVVAPVLLVADRGGHLRREPRCVVVDLHQACSGF